GTGKTHTIVEMVLRILGEPIVDEHNIERFIHIREVLLVTYTEKAAGELKKKIREGLECRIRELDNSDQPINPDLKSNLANCLNNLHEALIGTIHGVCLRLLQTWPFETGVHFSTETADDSEGLEHSLRESMRTDWQDEATCIPWALSLLAQQGNALEEKHFGLIRDTAEKLLDDDYAVLDRGAIGNVSLAVIRNEYDGLAAKLANSQAGFAQHLDGLIDAMKQARKCGRMVPDRLQMLDSRLAELTAMRSSKQYSIPVLQDPLKYGRSKICTKPDLKIPALAALDRAATEVSSHDYVKYCQERTALLSRLVLTLICDAAEILAKRWNRVKRGRGLLSFGDMLRLMRRAVVRSPEFLTALRARLRFSIIDEFQDTSIPQWEIFKRVFLDDCAKDGPRIFIVGDPKQSIYSFQGADVQSYLQAKRVIAENNGGVYSLETNYRSLPEMIDGYNSILGRVDSGQAPGEDWFAFDSGPGSISYPSEGKGGGLATAAGREKPAHPLARSPMQVMVLAGNAPVRYRQMAEKAAAAIKALKGTTVSVPSGEKWSNIELDYKDFAVIVEAHHLAEPFLERFQEEGIPAVKYKMEGVFQSAMARDLHALLRAIAHHAGDPAPRLAVLLTHFFNKRPQDIDPDKDLEPCARGDACANDNLCVAHALQEWTHLAASLRWSQLFGSIFERTGVRERLVRLSDGQRALADLRQVADYCLERLYRGNLGLVQLVEHLDRLLDGRESAGQDENLHVLATEKSSVRVLTMHAAKGLEFPVVFAVTGGSKGAPGAGAISWTAADGTRHVMPVLSNSSAARAASPELSAASAEVVQQATQERRRLLYVALTRAEELLVVSWFEQHPQRKARRSRLL
ncbi:MAG TPA: UvrD-helicase domain-containing protein, partial [Chitinivibrionales bacterium]|nr:UvrD-helicase domain-containing protein [Chitinivibrionales bacterium]